MKKLFALIPACLLLAACCLFAACGEKPDPVVITADDPSFEYNDKTLKDYMDYLQENGELSYTISNGMVTEINGTANTTNSYWMLYTSDSENANEAWGTLEHEGAVYGSSMLGAESLTVKENCVYVWAYQTF